MSQYRRRHDKRKWIVILIAAAVILLCLYSSSKAKHGSDFTLTHMIDAAFAWLDGDSDAFRNAPRENPDALENTDLTVHFIDVGQAKSILIQAPESTVLIDSGDNGGTAQLIAYLHAQSVKRIDILIATHPHADHIGGMDKIVEQFDIGEIIMPDIPLAIMPTTATFTRLLEAIDSKGLSITPAQPGKTYDLGSDTTLQILSPAGTYDDLNNISVASRLAFRQVSFLFTGDIEAEAEADILESGLLIPVDVLDVAHHGSSSSSTMPFLREISPQIAVFSCGIDNSYGHPHREVVESMGQLDIETYRTDLDGTVLIYSDGQELMVVTEK